MSDIRITWKGEPADEAVLYSAVREHGGTPREAYTATHLPIYCHNGDCLAIVSKPGNYCGVVCYTQAHAPEPVTAEPVTEPESPIAAYFRMCAGADWFYNYSDDSSVWRRGKAEIEALYAAAATSPTHEAIYAAWSEYVADSQNRTRPALDAFITNDVEETPVSTIEPEHLSPCGSKECIDLECQVHLAVRHYLLMNVSEKQRVRASEVATNRMTRLLESSEHGTQGPDFFIDSCIEAIDSWIADPQVIAAASAKHAGEFVGVAAPDGYAAKHVQADKPVLESPAKATRKPRTAKHQPRVTDGQEHPVIAIPSKEQEVKTYTQVDLERAIKDALAKASGKRVKAIKAAKAVQGAPEDKPVEIVKKGGGRAKIERIKEPEGKGIVLDGFVVDATLTVDDLHIGDLSLDTVVSSATRRIYNKARFRLTGEPVLPTDVTYRTIAKVHATLFERANAKTGKKVGVKAVKAIEQAKAVAEAPATNKTHVWKGKAVTAKQYAYFTRGQQVSQPVIAVAVDIDTKALRKAKVKALIAVGYDKATAKALVKQG